MLDFDLPELYQVSTSALNQSVKRNAKRFPPDFMFQITQEEFDSLKSQIVTSSWGGTRKLPNAFTEQGLAMLSGVLNSDTAIDMNIRVMRAFVSMRAFLLNGNIAAELNQLHCRVKKLERTSDETLEAINDLSEDCRRETDEIYFALSQLARNCKPDASPDSAKRTKNNFSRRRTAPALARFLLRLRRAYRTYAPNRTENL